MAISFIRVDDRLIHGQVLTRWMSEQPCDGVVAVDDLAAKDPIISQVLKSAVPQPLKGFVMTVAHTAERWPDIIASQRNYFLIVKTPETLVDLLEAGVDFVKVQPKLNVGNLSARDGAVRIGPTQSVTAVEVEAFDKLAAAGMSIELKALPEHKATTWAEVRKDIK